MAFSSKKSPKSRAECLSYFDNCKENILKDACTISQETILTSVMKQKESDSEIFECAITSTPNCKTSDAKKKILKSIKSEDLFPSEKLEHSDFNGISVSKVLYIVDKKRKEVSAFMIV